MSWRTRRQFTYFSVLVLIALGIVGILLLKFAVKTPTCSDKVKNGGEDGIDCGGQCLNYCPATVPTPTVIWTSVFPVTDGIYNVVSYQENKSAHAGVENADFTITLYDASGNVITDRKDTTFITPATKFVVFVPQIKTGARIPVRARLVWNTDLKYVKVSNKVNTLAIKQGAWQAEKTLGVQRLSVTLNNDDLYPVPESEYDVIVYDENDEPIAASKTIAEIQARGSSTLFFSWPYEFASTPKRYELIKRVNPFLYDTGKQP